VNIITDNAHASHSLYFIQYWDGDRNSAHQTHPRLWTTVKGKGKVVPVLN